MSKKVPTIPVLKRWAFRIPHKTTTQDPSRLYEVGFAYLNTITRSGRKGTLPHSIDGREQECHERNINLSGLKQWKPTCPGLGQAENGTRNMYYSAGASNNPLNKHRQRLITRLVLVKFTCPRGVARALARR